MPFKLFLIAHTIIFRKIKNIKNIYKATSFVCWEAGQFIKSINKRILGYYMYLLYYNSKSKIYISFLYKLCIEIW